MKFGCVAPSVVSLPWDLHALLPAGVEALTATLNNRNGRPGERERVVAAMRGATDVLIDEGARAIVVMGVPVAARRGLAADRSALAALTDDRGGLPIVSSLEASALALRRMGVKKPLLVTQYDEATNAAIATYLGDCGVGAAGVAGLGATSAAQVNALGVADYEALTRLALAAHPSADGIFLSARGNLFALTRALEAAFAIPAIEQVQASVWWALAELGVAPAAPGGRLFPPGFPASLQ